MKKQCFNDINIIIWDWNGTLLNDVDVCVNTLNLSLVKRNLPELSIDFYRSIFTFPVIDYYKLAGFEFQDEPFEKVAVEFMENYRKNILSASLHPQAFKVLEHFMQKGVEQHVLSAMEQGLLEKLLRYFQIDHYFRYIQGVSDDCATGKNNVAQYLVDKLPSRKQEICLVGDTLHDLEVARQTGIRCILYGGGHQSYQRLSSASPYVIHDLDELPEIISPG
jgi:phosphoglycolate phosphatase